MHNCLNDFWFDKKLKITQLVEVHQVTSKRNGLKYVLKQFPLTDMTLEQKQDAFRESELMSKLKHPNIVLHKQSFEEQNQLNILMEFCEN